MLDAYHKLLSPLWVPVDDRTHMESELGSQIETLPRVGAIRLHAHDVFIILQESVWSRTVHHDGARR